MNTILIVDDSTADLHVTQTMLRKADFVVTTACNLQEINTQISAQESDLILLDVVLHDRNRFEIYRDLEEEDHTKKSLLSSVLAKAVI